MVKQFKNVKILDVNIIDSHYNLKTFFSMILYGFEIIK